MYAEMIGLKLSYLRLLTENKSVYKKHGCDKRSWFLTFLWQLKYYLIPACEGITVGGNVDRFYTNGSNPGTFKDHL